VGKTIADTLTVQAGVSPAWRLVLQLVQLPLQK
jgi:hypothetical protein